MNRTVSNKHIPTKQAIANGGNQSIYRFPNGYGASVVAHKFSYGLELAVAKFNGNGVNDWDICYSTPITNDVLGHLSDAEMEEHLDAIAALPSRYFSSCK
jgi:hypothetical protein